MKTNPIVYAASLSLRDTNEELVEMMRQMRAARQAGVDAVICCVSGFENDPRELWQIPEVRAFFRRLVTHGFISWLDVFAGMNPDPNTPEVLRMGFGACEVWLISEGVDIGAADITLTATVLEDLKAVLHIANEVSDAMIGS